MTTKTRKPAKAATPKAAPEQGPDFDLATVGIAKLIARLRWLEADCRYKADLSDVFGHAAQRRTRSNLAKIEKYELQARSTRELAQIAASFAASAQIASSCFEFPMKLVPIALLIFVAPAFAEELPINRAATICKPGWTKAVRPPFRVMDRIKR